MRIIRTLATISALVAMGATLGGCWDTGAGDKVGTITRLNKRGVFCKTWEGEIIRGGLNTGSGVMGGAFHFTIESEDLAKKVQHYMDTQQEVKIGFRSEGITFCRSDSNDYFLTSIEPLSAVATPPVQAKPAELNTAKSVAQGNKDDVIIQLLQQNNKLMEKLLAK